MTTAIGAGEIELLWADAACDETVMHAGGSQAVRSIVAYDFGGCVFDPKLTPFPLRDGAVKDGASTTAEHDGIFWVKSMCSGLAVVERVMLDEWRQLGLRYNPCAGAVNLQVNRKDAGGSVVGSVLKAECIEAPTAFYAPDRGGIRTPGMRPGGYLVYPVRFRTATPFWQSAANTVNHTFALSLGIPVTANLDNPGARPCGGRISIANVSGSPKKITVENNTTGKSITVETSAAAFTNGDYVDWFYTNINDDPTWSAAGTLTITPNDAEFELALGLNNIHVSLISTSGSCDAVVAAKRLDFSY
jgi:hypothetical protein